VTQGANGAWSWSLPTTDNGAGTVVVRATDSGGLFVEDSFTWTANNVAPVSGTVNDATGNEGGTLATGGTFTDVAADPLTITKFSGAGTVVDNGNGTWSWSLPTTDQVIGSVTVSTHDGDGGVTSLTFSYKAVNVDPTVTTPAPDINVNESDTSGDVTSSGIFADVAGDTPLIITGTAVTDNGDNTWTGRVDDSDNRAGDITATANDSDGGSASDTLHYVVHNVAPAVAVDAGEVFGVEGVPMTATGAFTDVVADPLTISADTGTLIDHHDGTWSWTYTAADDESGTVTVTANDGDGGVTTDTFGYVAANVQPAVGTAAADATGSEGNTLTTHGSFTDVPADLITITSNDGLVTDNGDGTWSWSLSTTDDISGTVVVTATDDDDGTTTHSFDYVASDVPPAVGVAAADANGVEGGTLTTSGSFTKAAVDIVTVAASEGALVDNGDGTWS
jgi:hypothetical protein